LPHRAVGSGRRTLNQAHAAVGRVSLREPGMIAEIRYVDADTLRRLDYVLAVRNLQLHAVDLDLDQLIRRRIQRGVRLGELIVSHESDDPVQDYRGETGRPRTCQLASPRASVYRICAGVRVSSGLTASGVGGSAFGPTGDRLYLIQ